MGKSLKGKELKVLMGRGSLLLGQDNLLQEQGSPLQVEGKDLLVKDKELEKKDLDPGMVINTGMKDNNMARKLTSSKRTLLTRKAEQVSSASKELMKNTKMKKKALAKLGRSEERRSRPHLSEARRCGWQKLTALKPTK